MTGKFFLLTLLAMWAPGVAKRVQTHRHEEETNGTKLNTMFECPAECQQCCNPDDTGVLGVYHWGVSKDRFNCVLKDHSKTPNTECSDVKKRSHANRMYETECPFPSKEGNPWEGLKHTPCSKFTKCCCDSKDLWTEDVCLDAKDEYTEAVSSNPQADGKMQRYQTTQQSYTNKGECVGGALAWQYQTSYEHTAEDHGKCCMETEWKSKQVTISGSCSMQGGYWCDTDMCSVDRNCNFGTSMCGQSEVCQYEKKEWRVCSKFQQLFYCAEDKLHPTQTRYKRVPPMKGVCMGDNTNPAVKAHFSMMMLDKVTCPSGWEGSKWGMSCTCEDECGGDR